MRRTLLSLLFLLPSSAAEAQVNTLLPVPRAVAPRAGRFVVDSTTTFAVTAYRDARLERAVQRASVRLAQRVAQPLPPALVAAPGGRSIAVVVAGRGMAVQGLDEDESYRLDISDSAATLHAATVVGAIRGLETLLQLVSADARSFFLPALTIEDAPRFPWRGLLLDVSRHFMPLEQVRRTLDGMAMVKLNVLHWHLSDDQGFRVESKRFPGLHERGSDGLYYTQDEIRGIVRYAADRGIRVVPEFDMPGHATSWLVAYPQYGTRAPPVAIRREWGGADAIFDPTQEATYTFIAQFIDEMVPLFPDAYWHIGGDEVEDVHWNSVPRIVAWRTARGFRDNAALQAHFNQRISRILATHGRRMVGWDEILHPALPPRTVVQSWRGTQYLADAVKRGFSGILSAPWYLDHIKPASDYYLAEPVPQYDLLTPAQQALVLGGEACMWAEFITHESADSRIWPRLGAVAERLWSPREVTDVEDMYRRLDILAARLEGKGFRVLSHSARFLRRLAPGVDVAPVESLLAVVQPPGFGQTMNGVRPNQFHPLTRVVDAARPDPPGRWLVERLVRRVIQSPSDSAARDSLATLFRRWSGLTPAILALGERSPALAQAVPAASALARVSAIGLEALGYAAPGVRPPPEWRGRAMAGLQGLDEPQGLLRVAITGEVRKLVGAVARSP